MKKILFSITTLFLFAVAVRAQNNSPFWSLQGNSNADAGSKLGTTNNVSLRFYTNDIQRMIINSANGNVGIGITSPVNILTVKSSGGIPAASWLTGLNSPVFLGFAEAVSSEFVLADASNIAGRRAVIQGRRSRGTLASPSVVANNDFIASFLASAYDGSAFVNPATIDFYVDGTPSAGSVPARISFVTGTSIDDRVERLKVGSTGNFNFNNDQLYIQQSTGRVGIGTTSPSYKLQVVGGSYSGIYASTSSSYGVFGTSSATFGFGVYGNSGYLGVYGVGGTYGVYGYSNGAAYGVYGSSSSSYSANGSAGVYGTAYYGVRGEGTFGAYGSGTYGTYGTGTYTGAYGSGTSYGVIGSGSTGTYGSGTNYGLYAYGSSGTGIYAASYGAAGTTNGVDAYAGYFFSNAYRGIYASSNGTGYYAGYFDGVVYSTASFQSSDKRLKKNIKDVSNAMDIISQLQPKNYEFRDDGNYAGMGLPKGTHYGLLAQDLEKILPNLVKEEKHTFNSNDNITPEQRKLIGEGKMPSTATTAPVKKESIDLKAVNYIELIPIMVKAMQEQQATIEKQNEKIEALTQLVNGIPKNGHPGGNFTLSSASLGNPVPNPSSKSTKISYAIPSDFTSAEMVITNQAGQKLKQMRLNNSGLVDIDTSRLSAGTYSYTLVVDGITITTKKMVITR